MKLIIIDDEPSTALAVEMLCDYKALGIEAIFKAFNGREALERIRKEHSAVVLLDMKMPVMDGVQFLQKLEEERIDIPVIVISNYSDFRYTKKSIQHNVVDYILKPIDGEELNRALEKAIKRCCLLQKTEDRLPLNEVLCAFMQRRATTVEWKFYSENEAVCNRKMAVLKVRSAAQNVHSDGTGERTEPAVIVKLLEEMLQAQDCICPIGQNMHQDGAFPCLLAANADSEKNTDALAGVQKTLLETFGLETMWMIGAVARPTELAEMYDAAISRLREIPFKNGSLVSFKLKQSISVPPIYAVKDYLDKNYAQEIRISELARQNYMSRENMLRLFREEFSVGTQEYLIRIRMEKAKALLMSGERIGKVAEMVGYRNLNYFSKAFNRYWGVRPSMIAVPHKEEE